MGFRFLLQTFFVTVFLIAPFNAEIPVSNTCQGCGILDEDCSCTLEISYGLSCMFDDKLIRPVSGAMRFVNGTFLNADQMSKVITTDGVNPELVITVNGQFPGPNIVAYEDQNMSITVINRMHTDSTSVHWHGIHQRGTPSMDGVAMISQCPIAPEQSFVYQFIGSPHGTNFYHAHIGDQRSMGLYGGLIIKPRREPDPVHDEFVVLLQDWNHDLDPETAYYTMVSEQYDFRTDRKIPTTYSVDSANFSRFAFQSGLINGKGRFYDLTQTSPNNGAPLEIFNVTLDQRYRFRVISAATLYPFTVRIQDHKLLVVASDGFEIDPVMVDSFVVHPGERYDFILEASDPTNKEQYMLVAETLEVNIGENYHAAEAIISYSNAESVNSNPPITPDVVCSVVSPCKVLNCPFPKFPNGSNAVCVDFNDITNNDSMAKEETITGPPDKEMFLNFAFPGYRGNTPGSVNGYQFEFPPAPILTQPNDMRVCDPFKCRPNTTCSCTYTEYIQKGQLIQLVLTNMGVGSGWSHPVHFHGHSMYITEIGYGAHDRQTGKILGDNDLIVCPNPSRFCNDARWKHENVSPRARFRNGLEDVGYPQKDTIIVPTGGYVVARFRADNPGTWFLHCHIDLHNTNGMAMVLIESLEDVPPAPSGFPACGNFRTDRNVKKVYKTVIGALRANIKLQQRIENYGKLKQGWFKTSNPTLRTRKRIRRYPYDETWNDWKILTIVLGVICAVLLVTLIGLIFKIYSFKYTKKRGSKESLIGGKEINTAIKKDRF